MICGASSINSHVSPFSKVPIRPVSNHPQDNFSNVDYEQIQTTKKIVVIFINEVLFFLYMHALLTGNEGIGHRTNFLKFLISMLSRTCIRSYVGKNPSIVQCLKSKLSVLILLLCIPEVTMV